MELINFKTAKTHWFLKVKARAFGSTHIYAALFVDSYQVLRGRAWELLPNSPGWDFLSEIGLACAGSNEGSRQNKWK